MKGRRIARFDGPYRRVVSGGLQHTVHASLPHARAVGHQRQAEGHDPARPTSSSTCAPTTGSSMPRSSSARAGWGSRSPRCRSSSDATTSAPRSCASRRSGSSSATWLARGSARADRDTASSLLTGAAGGVGRALLPALRRRRAGASAAWFTGARSPRPTGSSTATSPIRPACAAPWTGADVVLHLAARTHARRADDYIEANVDGTRRLLDAAARRRGRPVRPRQHARDRPLRRRLQPLEARRPSGSSSSPAWSGRSCGCPRCTAREAQRASTTSSVARGAARRSRSSGAARTWSARSTSMTPSPRWPQRLPRRLPRGGSTRSPETA